MAISGKHIHIFRVEWNLSIWGQWKLNHLEKLHERFTANAVFQRKICSIYFLYEQQYREKNLFDNKFDVQTLTRNPLASHALNMPCSFGQLESRCVVNVFFVISLEKFISHDGELEIAYRKVHIVETPSTGFYHSCVSIVHTHRILDWAIRY